MSEVLPLVGVALVLGSCTALVGATTGYRLAFAIAVVRLSMVAIYHGLMYEPAWNFQDDFQYLRIAEALSQKGYHPLSILNGEFWADIMALNNGLHILYSYWNMIWIQLIGPSYSSPVVGNVILTFAVARLLTEVVESTCASRDYLKTICIFYLLHPDTVSWSTVLNFKDVMVQFLIFLFVVGVMAFRSRRHFIGAFYVVASCILMLFLRYYAVVFMLTALFVWLIVHSQHRLLYGTPPLLAGVALVLMLRDFIPAELFDPSGVVYGLVRTIMTPQPWVVEYQYAFITVAAWTHWLLLPAALLGAVALIRYPSFQLLAFYTLLALLFYATVPELQGVRQRFQIVPIFIWAQAHVLFILLRAAWGGSATGQLLLREPVPGANARPTATS